MSQTNFLSEFVSPAAVRSALKRKAGDKYKKRKDAQAETRLRAVKRRREEDELAVTNVFA
jgi:ribosome biogenesis protein BRX1